MDWSTIVYILAIIAMIWVIYDVVVNQKSMPVLQKIIWIVCALFFSIITAIVYYLFKKT